MKAKQESLEFGTLQLPYFTDGETETPTPIPEEQQII